MLPIVPIVRSGVGFTASIASENARVHQEHFCVVIEGARVLQEIKKFVGCFAVESARILSQCLGLTFVLSWKVYVFCNVRVCTLCCRGKCTYSAMSGFVLCVAVESARILQCQGLYFVLPWKVHVFCRQCRSLSVSLPRKSVGMAMFVLCVCCYGKCTYSTGNGEVLTFMLPWKVYVYHW